MDKIWYTLSINDEKEEIELNKVIDNNDNYEVINTFEYTLKDIITATGVLIALNEIEKKRNKEKENE